MYAPLAPGLKTIDDALELATLRVLLFDAGAAIVANFGTKLPHHAERSLGRIGVEIHTGTRVTGLTYRDITVEGPDGAETIPCHVKVWAAGVTASPLAKMLADTTGAETDRAGRIQVLPDCTLPGHPEVFAIGDMMALNNVPGVAEVAMQSGIHAHPEEPPPAFEPPSPEEEGADDRHQRDQRAGVGHGPHAPVDGPAGRLVVLAAAVPLLVVRVAGEMPAADPEEDHRADGEAGEHGVAEGPRVPSRSRGASRHSSAEPRRSRPCSRPGPELLDETGRDADREVDQEQGPEEMGQP
jgi:hypothetical protein